MNEPVLQTALYAAAQAAAGEASSLEVNSLPPRGRLGMMPSSLCAFSIQAGNEGLPVVSCISTLPAPHAHTLHYTKPHRWCFKEQYSR